MNLTKIIPYAGSYREIWDDSYKLKIVYEKQKSMKLCFQEGRWHWDQAAGLPVGLTFEESFFTQAADAAVAAERFIASGQTETDFSKLSPDGQTGPIFAAECLRSLLDDYGLQLETIYPYVLPCLGSGLDGEEIKALDTMQPRSCHLLQLLMELRLTVPAVHHDIRLNDCRCPQGTVEAGSRLRLAFLSQDRGITEAAVELWGDTLECEIPMQREKEGWSATFQAPETPSALWYRFRMRTVYHQELQWICSSPDGIHSWLLPEAKDGFRLTVSVPGFRTPEWFQHSVMYQIFPDRFAFTDDGTAERGISYHRALGQTPELHADRSEEVRWQPREFEKDYTPDDFYGGTLKGICEQLPYLKSLGVNCLYLNPIVESRSNHRYDTSDYLRVDPILGTNEDFNALCSKARQQGIRIICDGVFSHTGADSIYFNRDGHYPNAGACQKEPSPYDTWYDFRHFPDDYRSWWGFRELPEVNELDPAWQKYVVTGENSVVRQWLRHGASGWRLDVADELPDEVLELIRQTAKEENTDNLVLGEVWEDAVLKESYGSRRRYALGTALDSVMNYPFRSAVLNYLHGRISAFEMADFLTAQQMHYPKPLYCSLMNLLGSHDVERIRNALASPVIWKDMARADQLTHEAALTTEDWQRADRLERLAFAIQFAIPGVPCIYYGDELAMTGTNDPFNRRPMRTGALSREAESLKDEVRRLVHQRAASPALNSGEAFFLASDADVLLILRHCPEETFLTVVNRSEEEHRYALWLPEWKTDGTIGPCMAETIRI